MPESVNLEDSIPQDYKKVGEYTTRRLILFILGLVASIFLIVAVVMALSLPTASNSKTPQSNSLLNQPMIAFSLHSLQNPSRVIKLASFTGHPIVINFFASWCTPCREELPQLERAWKKFGSQVTFIGIDVKDSPSNAKQLLKTSGVKYLVMVDPQASIAYRKYGFWGLPDTVLVNSKGYIKDVMVGKLIPIRLYQWLRHETHS
ncbi:MAG: TlpA family protein disulfide reductase [Actinobacteria bacterium]|jgi:thiol-disulfide isomerase/thioredoxin|nr:TlpA family protein disulfide reductase [Actinomycetota bacterium]MCL6105287.1 TlpA family protein disulfide reductase [Actinomycetota bacterium]